MYLKCPRCHSYFEMAAESLGKRGREVRCSVCSKTWKARQRELSETLPQDDKATQEAHAPVALQASVSASPASVAPPPPPPPRQATSDIPSPHSDSESVTDRLEALTQHHHSFAPLQFTERSLEQPLNNLLRFAFAWGFWGLSVIALLYVVRTYPIEVLNRFPNAIHFYERLDMSRPAFAKLLLDGENYSLREVKVTSEYRLARDLIVVRVLVGNRADEEKSTPILRGTFRDARGIETNYFHFQPEEESLPAKGVLEYNAQVALPQATSTTLTLNLLSMFEKELDLGGNRLKVHNTRAPPAPAPSANEAQSSEQP